MAEGDIDIEGIVDGVNVGLNFLQFHVTQIVTCVIINDH